MTPYGAPELAASFRTVRNNTIQIAEDIPESSYSFCAAPGTRTVAQTLTHIALAPRIWHELHGKRHLSTFVGFDFFGMVAPMRAEEEKPHTKAELLKLLRDEGDQFAGWLESLSPEFLSETFLDHSGQITQTRFHALLGAKEHEMHHRGQLMLIERMLGIVPHLTRRMEEMIRQRQAASAGAKA